MQHIPFYLLHQKRGRTCIWTIEQDHRRVKFRTQPMLGFKSFYNAKRVLIGIELVQKIYKGQFHVPASFGPSLTHVWSNVLACS